MTMHDLVVREPNIGRKTCRYQVLLVVLWLVAIALGALMLSGCNTVVQGVNGIAKDTLIAAAAVKASTDGGLGRSSFNGALPPSGQGSMETDNAPVISFKDAEALAAEYGYSIER